MRHQGQRVVFGESPALAELVRRYPAPGALVVACARRSDGKDPQLRGLVLTARHGLTQVSTPMLPLDRAVQPVDVELSKDGTPCHLVTLRSEPRLVAPKGFRAPMFHVEGTMRDKKRFFDTFAELDKPVALPPGSYRAVPVFPHVVLGPSTPIVIEADGTKEIEVRVVPGLTPCRLEFASVIEDVPIGGLWNVALSTETGKGVLAWSGWHAGDAQYSVRMSPDQWLLPQRYVLRAEAPGVGKEQATIEVRSGVGSVQVLRLEFDGMVP
ncbi:MAG: hypothetical protein KDC87_15350 [Planctomycetes bacterium]|nr:hypothetical protein [Planctomycetota bacterium]